MPAFRKIFVAVQLSSRARPVLRYVADLHERHGASVDVFYVWTRENDPTRELEAFASAPGAFRALDELTWLARRGSLCVRGWLVPSDHEGSPLSDLAERDSYTRLIDATSLGPDARFVVARRTNGRRYEFVPPLGTVA